jgi:AcrR family transcriptional regulator
VTDVTAGRMRADARRNRERVLEVADDLFGEIGVKAQMDDVAERAGVGVGTVYRHFPTKAALLEAVITMRFESMLRDVQAAASDPDPGVALRRFASAMADHQARNRALAEGMASEIDLPVLLAGVKESMQQTVTELVGRAQAAGAIRADIGPSDVSMLLSGIAHVVELAGDLGATLRRRYLTIVLDGLRPADASPLPGRPHDLDEFHRLVRRHRSCEHG